MNQLNGLVQSAPANAQGFDADTAITLSVAQEFFDQGYTFCLRYLSLGAQQQSGDLSYSEASAILQGGLALMPVQHVPNSGWSPSAALGSTYGGNAASNAATVGFPAGVNVWMDLEGIATGTAAQDIINYCNNWYAAVAAAGFVPGIYVGANCGLSGDQLYDLPFQHYWKSLSTVPAIPVRGYQMTQTLVSAPVNGIGIDGDTSNVDQKGGAPQWLAPA